MTDTVTPPVSAHVFFSAVESALAAGGQILDVYDSDFAVEHKEDCSPLTEADKRSHALICERLKPFGLPVLSEEGKSIPFEKRSEWKSFWLVDPLDGTKEFVKRNGEFTVNIALIRGNSPVAGVIYVPTKNLLYFAFEGIGAFRLSGASRKDAESLEQLAACGQRLPLPGKHTARIVVASRSHMSLETEAFIDSQRVKFGNVEIVSSGSSLKLCLVAEGTADIYPRFAPTMEWDTAAGQAIVEQSGGMIVRHDDSMPIIYNKENLVNPWFIVKSAYIIN